jgi:hypothetical protein
MGKIHARELESYKDFSVLWSPLFDDLRAATDVDATWTTKTIRPSAISGKGGKETAGEEREDVLLTEFETRALKQIEQGASEVLEHPTPGNVFYLRPVRVLKSCTFCHSDSKQQSFAWLTKSNRVDGVVISLQITLAQQKVEE